MKNILKYLKIFIPGTVSVCLVAAGAHAFCAPDLPEREVYAYSLLDGSLSADGASSGDAVNSAIKASKKKVKRKEKPAQKNSGEIPAISKVAEDSNATYKDGTFRGSAQGYGGTTTVDVTIKNSKIKNISVVSHHDDASFFSKAKPLLSLMVKEQTTNVDAVSGATFSSAGLIGATRAALNKARVDGKADESDSSDKTSKDSDDKKSNSTKNNTSTSIELPSNASPGNFPYEDGTYEGVGEGFGGDVVVDVTIKNQTIIEISVKEAADETPEYFSKAVKILDAILENQDTDVDAVSGATFSSNGILDAIADALSKAPKIQDTGESEDKTDTSEDETGTDVAGDASGTAQTPSCLYNDGEYTVTVRCRPDEDEDFDEYEITLTITLENDHITDISVDDISDMSNKAFVNMALRGMKDGFLGISDLTAYDDSAVDAVSGATCSSESLKEAVKEALDEAAK